MKRKAIQVVYHIRGPPQFNTAAFYKVHTSINAANRIRESVMILWMNSDGIHDDFLKAAASYSKLATTWCE